MEKATVLAMLGAVQSARLAIAGQGEIVLKSE
jgi:hypothetical protein